MPRHETRDMIAVNIDPALTIRDPIEAKEKHSAYDKYVDTTLQAIKDQFLDFFGWQTDNADLYSAEALTGRLTDATAWDRIKNLYRVDDSDYSSGEFMMMVQTCTIGSLVGFILGFRKASKGIRERFIEYHQATIWERPLDARSKMMDTIIAHGMRGGVKYGLKIGAVSFAFTNIYNIIVAARNKSGIIEYTAAGFIGGAVLRSHMGLSGALAGGSLAAALATVGGSLCYGLLRATGRTYEETAYWKKLNHVNRYRASLEKAKALRKDPDITLHEMDLNKANNNLRQEAAALTINPIDQRVPTNATK